MKLFDRIVIINDNYINIGVKKGTIGAIIDSPIRDGSFLVELFDVEDDVYTIYIKDMEVIKESDVTDEDILEDLPTPNPKWWCKVEDGYIVNLLGERKNRIAYDYDS
ncbi:MAG: hypothetical protein IJ033_05255 [Clostridia bacterium]|nr:hypothetical protein [Clostridia bacterium]